MVGHVAPEAAPGGPMAIVQDGDIVSIDETTRRLDLDLSAAEIDARLRRWTAPPPRAHRGVLAKYAQLVRSAAEGAVTT
jgi:dihydroxy-acid dehydratase